MSDYLKRSTTGLEEANAIDESTGAADAGKIPKTNAQGKVDESFLPTGVGDETYTAEASESLAAGDYINLFDDSGTVKMRKADASNGRRAHGFVRASFSAEATATAYGAGYINDQLTGLTPAATYYLSTTAGDGATAGPGSAASHIHQELGVALSATALLFVPAQPIALVGA